MTIKMRKSLLMGGAIAVIAIVITAIVLSGVIEQEEDLVLSNYPKLFEKDVVIVIGENATRMEYEGVEAIAENLHNITGNMPVIKSATKLTENDKAKCNLILVGSPNVNRALEEVYEMTNATRVTSEYPGENKGVLEILRNPWNEGKAMLLVEGSDEWGVKAGVARLEEGQEFNKSSIVVEWEETTLPDVMAAPKQIFIYVGEKEEFSFWKHNITVNYVSSSPEQILNVIADGDEKVVKINPTKECPNHHCGYYWQSENLDFSVRPITWGINKDTNEKIWSYSETWNTTDLHFKVSIIKSF